ncbi:beta-galactosidase GalB [Croceivirga sp. JEA036]|uniref:beta-galactosidase GalB n=1 Tax=Croceivirga sp. JEA036 TaxID=2721162 RepID=UPI00143985D1|nr:beta-galactosidase GalB [Croceivirga sp. JEA036]NJB35196.1 glycoside hydrolase family 2 protein [Croceivirga sp. JEA036]
MYTTKILSLFIIASLLLFSCSSQDITPLPDQNFNLGWLFAKGDKPTAMQINYDDTDWRKLNLPHDWAIEGPFDSQYNARTGGLPVHGKGWYRKHFKIDPQHKWKYISIAFEGAMNNTKVYLNGELVGERPFGYIGFEFDLTPHINFEGDNVLAVALAPEDLASRWYSGAGIYRDVHLKINNPIHVAQWGTFITTPEITNQEAKVHVQTTLKNTTEGNETINLVSIVKDENVVVTTENKEVNLKANSDNVVVTDLRIAAPKLWDVEAPNLYQLETQVWQGDTMVDVYHSSFGVRTIAFHAQNGFQLNGKRVDFKGVCMHHDLGPLGAAVNYRATERQMEIMKAMGVNAIRTSHNPPSSALLEICDRMGLLVIDEAFDEWQIGKVPNGYNKVFDQWHERDLRDMIKRDRNHPSVIMWSIGNEILEQGRKEGWKVAKMLNDICHDEDNTRPTTAGFNYYPASFDNQLAMQIDVVGLNYKPNGYIDAKTKHPDMILYGSETSSQTSSRGVYDLPITGELTNTDLQVSSYDVINGPPWAYPPDVEFDTQAANPYLLGEFMWTGFDYLGEPTPYGGRDNSTNGYWNDDWPSHASYFAPVDLVGLPKDRFYLYQSQWTTAPMVHVLPHWNWEGKEGQQIPVFAYTNAEEVELFVNGKSYGKKRKGVDITKIPAEYKGFPKGDYETKYRLRWDVPYTPGSLKVVAYTNGNVVAEKEIKTAAKASNLKLEADRNAINADGLDLSFITVSVVDANGTLVPKANNLVQFRIEGDGALAAVGNGDSASLESFQVPFIKAFSGKAVLIVKGNGQVGEIKITASSQGLEDEIITIKTE